MNMPTDSSPGLAAVAEYDAAGRHSDAINVLARATARGDAAAMSALGHRLLIGDRAPLLPVDATRFLVDASRLGDSAALDRVAALTAGGIYLRQSWQEALRLLAMAAAGGSPDAAGQLRVLDTMDLGQWLQHPQGENLHGIEQIRRYPGLMPKVACDWLIDTARGRLQRALVYDQTTGQDTTSVTRSNTAAIFNLAQVGVVHFLLQARMSSACGMPSNHMEAPAVLHYAVGEQITDHYDFVDPQSPNYLQHIQEHGQRMATFLMYLNDDYEGGATDFPNFGVRQEAVLGTGLCFLNAFPDGQPDTRMLHAGRPPLRGEKWIVSQFIRSRPRA
jgi:prolyl 4-hydroxylase